MAQQRNLSAVGLPAPLAFNLGGIGATGLTATGSTQGTALALPADINAFTTVAASTGTILPSMNQGDSVVISNQGANALSVYPPVGGTINALSANTAFSQTAAKTAIYHCINATTYLALLSA